MCGAATEHVDFIIRSTYHHVLATRDSVLVLGTLDPHEGPALEVMAPVAG